MPQSPAFLITVLVLNLVTDLIIILIPIPIIWPLKISLARKLGLLLMFCAGIFVMIAAILRVYFVLSVSEPHVLQHFMSMSSKIYIASKRTDCSYLVLPRGRCRNCRRTSYHDPTHLHPPILDQRHRL